MFSAALLGAALAMPPQMKQVLTARSSQQVLGLTGTVIDGASIKQAHRKLALACHPDRHCSYPDAAVCTSAHLAAVLLNNARDDLLSTAAHAQMIRPKIGRPDAAKFSDVITCVSRRFALHRASADNYLLESRRASSAWCLSAPAVVRFARSDVPSVGPPQASAALQ